MKCLLHYKVKTDLIYSLGVHLSLSLTSILYFSLQACTVLAKQLVNLRKQKNRSYATGSKIQAVGNQQKVNGFLISAFILTSKASHLNGVSQSDK